MKIYCLITGGLGNQLFQVSKLLYHLESKMDITSKVKILISIDEDYEKKSSSVIELFNLTRIHKKISVRKLNFIEKKIYHFLLLQYQSDSNLKDTMKNKIKYIFVKIFMKITHSEIVGDRNSHQIHYSKKNLFLVGYFQENWHTENLVKKFQFLLKDSYLNLLQKNFRDGTNLSIHVRLGDYLSHIDTFGVLSEKYYIKILESLKYGQSPKIIIFTNKKEEFVKKYPYLQNIGFSLYDDTDFNACETLILMINSNTLIMANSTFSWWAARISGNRLTKIYAPSPWFKNHKFSENIYLKDWNLIKSEWTDKN